MGFNQVDKKDVMLSTSLTFLMLDIMCLQDGFRGCPKPIHKWLIGSYGILVASRVVVMACAVASSEQGWHVLLNLRQKSLVLRSMVSATWWLLAPAFVIWSAVGASWSYEVLVHVPQCMPSSMHLVFLGIWQILSFLWVVQYVGMGVSAWCYERELRRAEVDMREIRDEDSEVRWGSLSTSLGSYGGLPAMVPQGGMSPAEIRGIGGLCLHSITEDRRASAEDEDCPICLTTLREGEKVRKLGRCGHTFHRSCIDLWLLRSTDCPLCKQSAAPGAAAAAAPPPRMVAAVAATAR